MSRDHEIHGIFDTYAQIDWANRIQSNNPGCIIGQCSTQSGADCPSVLRTMKADFSI